MVIVILSGKNRTVFNRNDYIWLIDFDDTLVEKTNVLGCARQCVADAMERAGAENRVILEYVADRLARMDENAFKASGCLEGEGIYSAGFALQKLLEETMEPGVPLDKAKGSLFFDMYQNPDNPNSYNSLVETSGNFGLIPDAEAFFQARSDAGEKIAVVTDRNGDIIRKQASALGKSFDSLVPVILGGGDTASDGRPLRLKPKPNLYLEALH